jgi:bis(5'-nucleosyl)-tetraphosphatase (symmetrical)
MALYLIGDVQGCDGPLQRLLDKVGFSPSRDTLYLLGDLVNRGPDSVGVLRRLAGYGAAARCLLGNHDLNLLAVAAGLRQPHRGDTLDEVLAMPEREAMMRWLREQPLVLYEHKCLMVHAGVLPGWTANQTVALAEEVHQALRGPDHVDFLRQMYGNEPAQWRDELAGAERLRVIVNALTRIRFCTPDGTMEFAAKEGLDAAPPGFFPWFEVPGRQTAGTLVAFGHWSTLGLINRPDLISLDTGCVWGGCLSALRMSADTGAREVIQVACHAAQAPGG